LGAAGIIDALLQQRLAGALRDPTMGLPTMGLPTVGLAVQDHRVDGAADVVNGGVADDLDGPGVRVDLHFADMKAVWERGDLARDLADAGERAAQLRGQTCVIPRRHRDGEQVERAVGAGDGEIPVGEIDPGFGGLEQMRRDAAALFDDFIRGLVSS